MRFDRSITLNIVQPWRRALTVLRPPSSVLRLPILMYHSISDEQEPGVAPYYKVCTSSAVFRQHMQHLADDGYRTITITELVKLLRKQKSEVRGQRSASLSSSVEERAGGRSRSPQSSISHLPSPKKLVALTFDDGYRNFYTEAWPILQQHGFTATMFLPTAFIGQGRRQKTEERRQRLEVRGQRSEVRGQRSGPSSVLLVTPKSNEGGRPPSSPPPTRHSFKGTECLTWDEVWELRKGGIEFGSHTVTHPRLIELTWKEIKSELSNSKSVIEHQLGEPITTFCYPYAFPQGKREFAARFTNLLVESGYTCCTTTEIGRIRKDDDAYRLKRLAVNSCDDLALFGAKLGGAYDWLATPQAVIKKLKGLAPQSLPPLSPPVTAIGRRKFWSAK